MYRSTQLAAHQTYAGHIGVAEAACAAMAQRTGQLPAGVVFELSVGNADKPTIDDKVRKKRLQLLDGKSFSVWQPHNN